MRSPRRVFATAILTPPVALALLVAACGVDVIGADQPVNAGDDGSEVSLPPKADVTNPPDADAGGADGEAGPPSLCGPDLGLRGPEMVPIPDAGFCIDSTEVTGAQYAEFLVATNGGTDAGFLDASVFDGGLPPTCVRDGYAPNGKTGTDAGPPNDPVTLVNWCDAFAYCQWAGKRLCKGGSGNSGEWLNACTRNGAVPIPATTGDASDCNVGRSSVAPPKSFPNCEGGYPGIFDMFGNVAEWVDDCDGGSSCALYGAYFGHSVATSCANVDRVSLNSYNFGRGIRCCR